MRINYRCNRLSESDPDFCLPTVAQRLAARERPLRPPVMFQEWRDLLFLHWAIPVATLQSTLPDGLFVDTFDGRAYLGIVPFFMRNIRPRFLPAVPGMSNFLELNLRTYVHDVTGEPGVWFYSLEANQSLAVAVARRFFHLRYEHAMMHATRAPDGRISFHSTRRSRQASGVTCRFEYAPCAGLPPPEPGSLEFFLVERYRLYAAGRGRLWRGAVFHEPYPLNRADVSAWDEHLMVLNGFAPTGRDPDHIIMSPGVKVRVVGLTPVEAWRARM